MDRRGARKEKALLWERRQKKRWNGVIRVAAAMVVFCTTYALILPAITMENLPKCGKEEHIHSEECYVQIAAEPDAAPTAHIHTDECYRQGQGTPVCGVEASEGHTHSASAGCYAETTALICDIPEGEAHTHGEECFETTEMLNCALEESEGHQHTENCYEWERVLSCGLSGEAEAHAGGVTESGPAPESGAAENVPAPENGTAESTGAESAPELTCTLPEDGNHTHGPLCYGEWKLICPLEEHTHSEACFSDPAADLETAADWEKTLANVELTGVWAEDVLAVAESQLGYQESDRNYTVSDDGRLLGYTRYGAWYGIPYGDWCAMFVSFCLNYSGVPREAFPWEASCPRWVEALLEEGLFALADADYQPGVGDLVFFDYDRDGEADHVGLVRELLYDGAAPVTAPAAETTVPETAIPETATTAPEAETTAPALEAAAPQAENTALEAEPHQPTGFATIEGNCGNRVARMEYRIDDGDVLGYGALSLLSEIATYAEGESWGYNPDGSIYWGREENLIGIDNIQEGKPYIIAGCNKKNVLTGTQGVDGSHSNMQTARPARGSFQDYEIWYFDPVDGGGYRIYLCLENGDRQYLKATAAESLVLTEALDQATVFNVSQSTVENYTDRVLIQYTSNGTTYYLNTTGEDVGSCRGWLGWSGADAGSALWILDSEIGGETARRVDTVSSTSTVMNLFDYWTAPNRTDADNVNTGTANQTNTGINQDHALKFVNGWQDKPLNTWTGANRLPRAGIVASTLGEDGYPYLSGNDDMGTGSGESLAYLFDPSIAHEGKASYRNVSGLLTVDREGYHIFDCTENMAEFDKASNSFHVYDQPGARRMEKNGGEVGQFFPFNKAPEIMGAECTDPAVNHYFGMTLTSRFFQQYGGHTDEHRRTPTTFHFSGDDDVWIFIDGVLVGDLGGTHDASGVTINFATGKVEVSVANAPATKRETTLYDCYEAAGKQDDVLWTEVDGNKIFKDNTTHTLRFFYLERGNNESNMELKYNLTEVPKTAIYKVDQYGEVIPGATFAVYAADTEYHMLSAKDGEVVNIANPEYNESGDIVDEGGNVLANALYTGTTNEQGEMLFEDQDGMPYTLKDLEQKFGKNFILREIKVPDGYRVVTKDTHLQIWYGENQTILKCDNTMHSGSRAASTLQLTATDTIHLKRPYTGSVYPDFSGLDEIQYCDPATGESKGTLFAVVFLYTGPLDENGGADLNADKWNSYWTPVYGSDKEGYFLIPMVSDNTTKTVLEAALEAAKRARDYGNVTFRLSPGLTMQLTLENLPGHITSYYRMLDQEHKDQARYTVGYYWTDADSLDEATAENTYGLNTFDGIDGDGSKYSGFDRVFGANIQIPNLVNKVFAQKLNEAGDLVNGATFAMYQVHQEGNGPIQYRDPEALTTQFVTDKDGRILFQGLDSGTYYLWERKAPEGYKKLTTPVRIVIKADGSIRVGTTDLSAGNIHVDVRNSTGGLLPTTGGMGTTLFYVLGGILAVGAAVLLITRKRVNAGE